MGPWRLLLLPDHATPLALRTHTADPVPYLLVDSAVDGPGGTYTEAGVADVPARAGPRAHGPVDLGLLTRTRRGPARSEPGGPSCRCCE